METLSLMSFYYVTGLFTTFAGGMIMAHYNHRPSSDARAGLLTLFETGMVALLAMAWPVVVPFALIDRLRTVLGRKQ